MSIPRESLFQHPARGDFAAIVVENNLGTITPEHRGKRRSRADQKARRVNKIANPALSAKPPSPVQSGRRLQIP